MIVKPSDCSYMWCSISAHLAERVNDFRNGPAKEECCGQVLMRRTLAEGFYLLIAVAAAVEMLVRAPLMLVGLALSCLYSCCDDDEDECGCQFYIDSMIEGSWECFQTASYALEALINNPNPRLNKMQSEEFYFHASPISFGQTISELYI